MQAPVLDRIEAALGRRPKLRHVDLRQVLMREREAPYTKIVFGDGNEGDVRSAGHLAGLPKVVEHVLAGVTTHGTVEATTLSGTFPDIFKAFTNEVGPGRWASRERATLQVGDHQGVALVRGADRLWPRVRLDEPEPVVGVDSEIDAAFVVGRGVLLLVESIGGDPDRLPKTAARSGQRSRPPIQ